MSANLDLTLNLDSAADTLLSDIVRHHEYTGCPISGLTNLDRSGWEQLAAYLRKDDPSLSAEDNARCLAAAEAIDAALVTARQSAINWVHAHSDDDELDDDELDEACRQLGYDPADLSGRCDDEQDRRWDSVCAEAAS